MASNIQLQNSPIKISVFFYEAQINYAIAYTTVIVNLLCLCNDTKET